MWKIGDGGDLVRMPFLGPGLDGRAGVAARFRRSMDGSVVPPGRVLIFSSVFGFYCRKRRVIFGAPSLLKDSHETQARRRRATVTIGLREFTAAGWGAGFVEN